MIPVFSIDFPKICVAGKDKKMSREYTQEERHRGSYSIEHILGVAAKNNEGEFSTYSL